MYDTPNDLLDALRATPAILDALLQGYTPESARLGAGTPGDWAVIEIVCHLRDASERALGRMRRMRDENNPILPGYDQEALASEQNYASADLAEALAAFNRFRQAQVAELAALAPEQWKRPGRHEELGPIDILSHTIHIVAHDFVHTAQIARKREPHAF